MKEIELTQGRVALVDDEDYERLSKHTWMYNQNCAKRSVTRGGKQQFVRMVHDVLKCPSTKRVEHINKNPLDNRKENLAIYERRHERMPEGHWKISLTQDKFALVDDEDFERVTDRKWCYTKNGYAIRTEMNPKRVVLMHREILQAPEGLVVDHINGDRLDNRRANLRLASHAENMRNCKLSKSNTSGYKGVAFDRWAGNWKAYINIDGKLKHLGRFPTAEEASACYEHHAKLIFKEFKRD